MATVRVSAKAFWFASQFKAQNDIRYYLNAVQIEKHPAQGAFVIGCDGRSIGVYHDSGATFLGDEPSVLVSMSKDADKYIKPTARIHSDRFVEVSDKRATVFLGEHTELFVNPGNCIVDGKYPDWKKVIPEISTLKIGTSSIMNAELIQRIVRTESAMAPSRWPTISFFRKEVDGKVDHSAGIAASFGSDRNAFAYFMPIRDGDPEILSCAKFAFKMLEGAK